MKSLDEVMKALSICGRHPDCEGCPYENISYPTEIGNTCKDIMHYDALHYLKTIETTENLYHDAVNELSKWKDEDWKDRCLPLTWDELRQMGGKPIWVEYSGFTPNWEIVENNGAVRGSTGDFTGRFVETNMSILRKEEQGKTWQAYRKERECGADMREDIPMEYFENGGI